MTHFLTTLVDAACNGISEELGCRVAGTAKLIKDGGGAKNIIERDGRWYVVEVRTMTPHD